MKDHDAREWLARIEQRLDDLDKYGFTVSKSIELAELTLKVETIIKALGYSFNEKNVFDVDIKDPTSSLGRLQLQISALIESLDLEEVWREGKLSYRQKEKTRR